ncbi:pentatricopeptide repeat-containing protein At2g04860-like [Papaver somniferum]|uniref:pentatricopeptide repeat-containing protein At2g04860-like n=1 Tax=Papaver somniferum TaxID=3469 RepID=UPI000E6FAF8F|nr:pentatricopeptide repeat-containing protein At2g04860-like [Papaver somniferum]
MRGDLDALELFCEMPKQGFEPCRVTLVTVLSSCARLRLLFCGRSIHGLGVKVGLDVDSWVQNSLTDMYGKCNDLVSARFLFKKMSDKCIVSWNTMISAYGQNGYFDEAMLVFKQMLKESVSVNSVTIVCLLSANNSPIDSTHSHVIKTGLDMDSSVITSLIYKRDMASAAQCFNEMRLVDLKPDAVVTVSELMSLRALNVLALQSLFMGMVLKVDSLLILWWLTGSLDVHRSRQHRSCFLFVSRFARKDTDKWNNAMKLFCQMKIDGCNPDPTTIVSLLSGCTQIGSLHRGRGIHSYILRHHLEMEDFFLTALIDMYTKCGSIGYAERLFQCIRNPCLATWSMMIMVYGTCGYQFEAIEY